MSNGCDSRRPDLSATDRRNCDICSLLPCLGKARFSTLTSPTCLGDPCNIHFSSQRVYTNMHSVVGQPFPCRAVSSVSAEAAITCFFAYLEEPCEELPLQPLPHACLTTHHYCSDRLHLRRTIYRKYHHYVLGTKMPAHMTHD